MMRPWRLLVLLPMLPPAVANKANTWAGLTCCVPCRLTQVDGQTERQPQQQQWRQQREDDWQRHESQRFLWPALFVLPFPFTVLRALFTRIREKARAAAKGIGDGSSGNGGRCLSAGHAKSLNWFSQTFFCSGSWRARPDKETKRAQTGRIDAPNPSSVQLMTLLGHSGLWSTLSTTFAAATWTQTHTHTQRERATHIQTQSNAQCETLGAHVGVHLKRIKDANRCAQHTHYSTACMCIVSVSVCVCSPQLININQLLSMIHWVKRCSGKQFQAMPQTRSPSISLYLYPSRSHLLTCSLRFRCSLASQLL